MKQEDKELLLKDLCGRLPYGVILQCCESVGERLCSIDNKGLINNDYDIEEVKPCLFPISAMTEEQIKEALSTKHKINLSSGKVIYLDSLDTFEFYNKNHIDDKGLVPMNLAVDATNLNVY